MTICTICAADQFCTNGTNSTPARLTTKSQILIITSFMKPLGKSYRSFILSYSYHFIVQQISSALFENSVELQAFSRFLIMMLKLSPHACLPSILLLSRDSLEISSRLDDEWTRGIVDMDW